MIEAKDSIDKVHLLKVSIDNQVVESGGFQGGIEILVVTKPA